MLCTADTGIRVLHVVMSSAHGGYKQMLDNQCLHVFAYCGVVRHYNLRFLVLINPLQVVLITIPVSLFVCPHYTCLGIYSVFYRKLHTWF
jgi:hypothetical protein